MDIIAAFGKRRGYDLEYYLPELITAVDEGTMDENPDFFQEEIRRVSETWGDEMEAIRVFEFSLPDSKLKEAFGVIKLELKEGDTSDGRPPSL